MRWARPAGAWLVGAALLRVTVLAPEGCPSASPAAATRAADAAAGWLQRSQRDDGSFVYEYDRSSGITSTDYNLVRHAGVTMSLFQAGATEAGDRGLAYALDRLVEHDDFSAFAQRGGYARVGASALLIAALVHRRTATDDTVHDEVLRRVGRFILHQQRPDGSILSDWDTVASRTVPDLTSDYSTGEAFWALAMLGRTFPGEGWEAPARRLGRFIATRRDDVNDRRFPPWNDQWAAYGFAELTRPGPGRVGLDGDEVAYVKRLAFRFGFLVREEATRRRAGLARLLRGRPARAAGLGVLVEGAASLWRTSNHEPRLADLRAPLAERITCGVGMLTDRQVRRGSGIEQGAWFTSDVTRMDDQQHALSGLLYGQAVLAGR